MSLYIESEPIAQAGLLCKALRDAQTLLTDIETKLASRFLFPENHGVNNTYLILSILNSLAAMFKQLQLTNCNPDIAAAVTTSLQKIEELKIKIEATNIRAIQLPQLIADSQISEALCSGYPANVWLAVREHLHRIHLNKYDPAHRNAIVDHLQSLCEEVANRTGVVTPRSLLEVIATFADVRVEAQ